MGHIGADQIREQPVEKAMAIYLSGHDGWRDIDRLLNQSLRAAFNEMRTKFPFFAVNRF